MMFESDNTYTKFNLNYSSNQEIRKPSVINDPVTFNFNKRVLSELSGSSSPINERRAQIIDPEAAPFNVNLKKMDSGEFDVLIDKRDTLSGNIQNDDLETDEYDPFDFEIPITVESLKDKVCTLFAEDKQIFFDILYGFPIDKMLIEAFLKYAVPADKIVLTHALLSYNPEILELVLKYTEENTLITNAEELMSFAKNMMNVEGANQLTVKIPLLLEQFDIKKLVWETLNEGNGLFFKWLLSKNIKLPADELQKLLSQAVGNHSLSMVHAICSYNSRNSVLPSIDFPEILGLDKITSREMLLERITHYAITTPLPVLFELAALMPQKLAEVLPEAMERASLCVRFPSLRQAIGINSGFADCKTYLESTFRYAEENLEFVTKMGDTFKHISRDQFLSEIIKNRNSRNPSLHTDYITKAKDGNISTKTSFYLLEKVKADDVTTHTIPRGVSRYSPSVKQFVEFTSHYKDEKDLKKHYPITIMGSTFQFHYVPTDPAGRIKAFPTTSRSVYKWFHTDPQSVRDLQPRLESLHRELLHFPLTVNNQKLFYDKLTEAYWLVGTLCETLRGTPHNAMIMLKSICDAHDLPPVIPKMEHYFLDNTMLNMPLEYAKEKFATFIEPTLDQALDRDSLKGLLAQNGKLLRYCSLEARNDPELVEIARR